MMLGWYDSELKEPCDMAPRPDNKTRCMPAATQLPACYMDARCTVPVAVIDGACHQLAYGVYPQTDRCATSQGPYYRIDYTKGRSDAVWCRDDAGACVISHPKAWYPADILPESTFVEATIQ